MLAEISRWPALARRFPGRDRPTGTILRGHVVSVGPVGEHNVTNLILTPAGLYMYASLLFRFRHAPIFVPWSEIHYEGARRFLWMKSHKLSVGGVTSIRITDRALGAFQPFLQTSTDVRT